MADLQDLKLYPRNATNDGFVTGRMTIQLDSAGNPVLTSGADALDQDVLKAIFTGTRDDGYGTVVHRVVGEKNLLVTQALVSYTVIASLQRLLQIHTRLLQSYPTQFRGRRCLQAVDFINVQEDDGRRTSLRVLLDFRTREGDLRQVSGQIPESKEF